MPSSIPIRAASPSRHPSPGEAREADIGIAGGVGEGLIIKKGEILRKVPEEDLLDSLRSELEAMAEARKK